jgi:hypothetical protein
VLGGHLRVLRQFGALPRMVVWDQEGAIRPVARAPHGLHRGLAALRGTFGIGVRLCQRGDPEAKGLVERANGYLETSFLPGRRFEDVAEFKRQLSAWLVKANNRIHATTEPSCVPSMGLCRHAVASPPPACLPHPGPRRAVTKEAHTGLPMVGWLLQGSEGGRGRTAISRDHVGFFCSRLPRRPRACGFHDGLPRRSTAGSSSFIVVLWETPSPTRAACLG